MLDPSILVGTTSTPSVGELPAVTDQQRQTDQQLETAQVQARVAEARVRLLATVLELQSSLDQYEDLAAAATQAARMLTKILSAQRVQIAWKDKPTETCRIIGDSDSSTEQRSPMAAAAAEEVCSRGATARLPCRDASNRHSLLALQRYAKSLAAEQIIAAPLTTAQGDPCGAVITIQPGPNDARLGLKGRLTPTLSPAKPVGRGLVDSLCDLNLDFETKPSSSPTDRISTNAVAFLDAACPNLTTTFQQLQQLQPRRWEPWLRSLIDPAFRRRRRSAAVLCAIFVAVMMIPVRYNVPAQCELQPVERRFIDAPFDGPLEKVLVRPGDVVQRGEPLARINPREIEYELAGLHADLKRAEQEKKGLVAEHDFAGSRIADLESQRIRWEADLLEYRRGNLEIRSPLDGVVVTGDLKKVEGTPLTKGEPLFEIAPLGDMIVEVAIPETDLAYVEPGMQVSFYLHAMPGQIRSGQLERIHPSAELRDHHNIFVGEVHLHDEQGSFRPGMRGRAWVHSGRRPLGWNLFHRAFFAVRHAVGW